MIKILKCVVTELKKHILICTLPFPKRLIYLQKVDVLINVLQQTQLIILGNAPQLVPKVVREEMILQPRQI